jgi:hypothetical protein
VQQANLLTSDKVAAMFVFHPVSPLVTRQEVNYPAENRIPDLVDLGLVTVSGWLFSGGRHGQTADVPPGRRRSIRARPRT